MAIEACGGAADLAGGGGYAGAAAGQSERERGPGAALFKGGRGGAVAWRRGRRAPWGRRTPASPAGARERKAAARWLGWAVACWAGPVRLQRRKV